MLALDFLRRCDDRVLASDIDLKQLDGARQFAGLKLFHSSFAILGRAAPEEHMLGRV